MDDQAGTAVVYDAGERRTHAEHAAEAYDFAQRADALLAMRDEQTEMVAAVCLARAQWHATMAIYHATTPETSSQTWRYGYEQCLRDIRRVDGQRGTTGMLSWLAEAMGDPKAAAERAE
jgi:hypothetical protein